MSSAGIRSNRGDSYQTLVALNWALTVLSDPEFQWIEIDSATHLVDDVVIGKSDGSLICCQCKKNQTDFRAWSIADLADELDKASRALTRDQQVQVQFFSRSEFGAVAKLREYSTLHGNETDFHANLTDEHKKTNNDLAARINVSASDLSTYEFLRRCSFEISPDFDRMETLLRERLRRLASNSSVAFDALATRLSKLSGRIVDGNLSASTQHRLTKDDLKYILHRSGAMLVPEISTAQVRTSFASTSAIGRSWHRDIAGQRIASPVVGELVAAIEDGNQAILVTGLPGSGKTCVMLSLQEALEQRMEARRDVVPLFIQSREFSDLATAQERQAQGLPEQWVEQAARLAEDTHVIVIIDSLDVLSIAREHGVLTYFLAQIDQLLVIPNVTVITACRDFDRKYDRRIAVREWNYEAQCPPLDWRTEILPLLDKLKVNSTTIDAATRELIRNPRELALFVELAHREGSFNVVTSQALAQRYLDKIVQADPALGNAAMRAIEATADAMLKSRSLSIPYQRFTASLDILRRLESLNVLQDGHDGKLTFGHQTLLDVLVISGAIRQGITLNEFIQGLPPVPFVRPSIRSFVAQLATGEDREFRRQLRAVLTGNAAFHIRRLVAESFAQQVPQADDWPLIRDLRERNREVFQVIYTQASSIEWHQFWFHNLVPALKEVRDSEGISTHIHRVAQWANEDPAGVLEFWTEALALDWLDGDRVAEQLTLSLSKFETENLAMAAPLLEQILKKPKQDHSLLGRTVARCIDAGIVDDRVLWRHIAGDVKEEDVLKFRFDNKLRCQPHEFGDKKENFLIRRMVQSTALLDLALEAIEQWSQIRSAHYGEAREGFVHGYLNSTSYQDAHSQTDYRHVDSDRILLDAIEAAILDHAQKRSGWWQKNRDRLCSSQEVALCYFSVLALTNYPLDNLDLIGRLLGSRELLKSQLSYELGSLARAGFVFLDRSTQCAVLTTVQSLWEEQVVDDGRHSWILMKRAEYISAIPCHLRSEEAQSILDTYESKFGTLIRNPSIGMRGGIVSAPFSYELFLSISDYGVVRLLSHYAGYNAHDDFLAGGEREVGTQLREASSRHPSRFLRLLAASWATISARYSDDIMEGAANYLAHRYGNLQTNAGWEPIENLDAPVLVDLVLDELERHPTHWRLNRSAAKALQACANVVQDAQNAERLVFQAIGFGQLDEESTIEGDSVDLLTTGINMKTGNVAEALMMLANNSQEQNIAMPALLTPALRRFASNQNPAIRAVILRHLPYLQSWNPELGWELFHRAMENSAGLWRFAERCLYYAYHNHFEKVYPLLERICHEGTKKDMETWGRIMALTALAGRIDFDNFLGDLDALGVAEAWQGAASVWTNIGNIRQHREQCFAGIEAGLKSGMPSASAVVKNVNNIFRETTPPIAIPVQLVQLFFRVFESGPEDEHHRLFGFDEWLNAVSQRDPEGALTLAETYLVYVCKSKPYFYDHENQLVQLVTRLFAEAEELEESDNGTMLKRVIAVQDLLLSLGVNSMDEWLKAAERQ